ncbi:hypothetical protein VPH35_137102 [Triticum aestivum]
MRRRAGFARVPLLLNERLATVILDSVADFVFAVNDSHGAPEDISDVVKDINDGMYSLNVDDGDDSLQLSVTQSQSVDGTEPVTQAEDVPMQLQLEDERIRKKKCDFQRRKELEWRQKSACVQRSDGDVAQAPEGVGDEGGDTAFSTVDGGSPGSDMPVKTNLMQTRLTQVFTRDAVKEKKAVSKRKMSDQNADGTQRRSARVKAGSQPERSLLKENKKRKVPPAKVNKGVKKRARVKAEDAVSEEDDIKVDSEDEFAVPISVMSSVKPVGGNAGKVALDEGGFGSIFKWKVKSNISRPLMGSLYLRIDPDTMTLDMGEANKKLRITSDGIHQLFGFPRGGRSAPRPSEDGYDNALMKLRSELDISKNKDIKTKDLRDRLEVLVKDPSKDDLALKVFFTIVFMKVVLPGAAPRVSREAAMFENLVIEDMANMDYCQLMVDELRRAVVSCQDGVTLGKAITGCAIGPVLMYLDCLIRGKTAEPDMRVPRICFMDPVKLSDLVDADLIKKRQRRSKDLGVWEASGHQFNVEEAVDYIEMERILIGDMRDGAADLVQSSVRLLNNMKHFKTMQDSRYKPYEESANVVIRQIEQDEAAATDSRAGDGTEANVSDHETNDVGLERPVVDTEQDEAAATDSRADDGTKANVSDHHTNDVGLEHPVVDETSYNVEAAVDRGVNDPSTDKCKDPIVGDEPCSTVGDVPLNVSSSKIDDVAVNASKMTDVEREAVVSGGDDACGVPLSTRRDVGTKVADEDVGAASILDAKSSGVGIGGNENVSDCEDLPPENFPPGGLDYGDALEDASSVEEVPSEDDDLLLSISSGPLTQEALVSSQDFLSSHPESAAILVSSQDLPSSNLETGGILVSSQELPSSNADSAIRFLRNMTYNIEKLWRESGIDRAKLFSPVHIDGFSCEFVRVPQQENTHDCGFFMLQNCKTYHCREDGVIEMLDYSREDILDIRKTLLYTCATSDVFDVDFRALFGIEPCEWLDLREHDYRIFGSQFSELERVAIDLSQGRSPEKTRSGVMKGRLGALKGSTAACPESPTTPKDPIVELIDSDDDAFDKIAGMGRVTRSDAAKGLSPLAGIVARIAGGARKDLALDSGNVLSTKRAPRAPIKFCSPVQQLRPHNLPHIDKARKLYNLLLSDEACEKYAENTFSMIPQPYDSVTSFTGKRIWEVFAPGQMMEGDVMDFLIDDWKKDPERNADFASGKRVLLSPYFITVVLDCTFYGDENKVFNVESAVRDFKSYVKEKEDLLSADLIMMPLFKPMVLPKDKKVNHFSLYAMNRYRSSVDILDSLPYPKNHHPSKNTYHKDCEKI